MDYDNLIEELRNNNIENNCHDCALGYYAFEAAAAIKAFCSENEKLRAEVESLKKGHCAGCSIPAVKAEQIRDLTDAPKLRAELERVKRERDAAVERLREWEKFDIYLLAHNFLIPEKWRGQKED